MLGRKNSCPESVELEKNRSSKKPPVTFPRVRYLAEKFSNLANENLKSSNFTKTRTKTQNQGNSKTTPIKCKNNKNSSSSEETDDIVFLIPKDCLDRSLSDNKKESTAKVRSKSDSEIQLTQKPSSKTPSSFQKGKDLNDPRSTNNKSSNGNHPTITRKYIPNPSKKTNSNIRYKAPKKVFTSTPNNSSSDINVDLDFGSSLTSILSDVTTDDALEIDPSQKGPRFKKSSPIIESDKKTSTAEKPRKKISSDLKLGERNLANNKNKNSTERKPTTSFKAASKNLSKSSSDGNTSITEKSNITKKNCANSTINSSNPHSNTQLKNQVKHETVLPKVNDSSEVTEIKSDSTTQLLHPAWRRVPWKDYFGWENQHQSLMETLKSKILKEGGSIYYKDEEEYEVAKMNWVNLKFQEPFLNGPWVTSVFDMLAMIEKEHELKPKTYRSLSRRNSRRKKNPVPATTCYDAESEGCS